MVLPGRVCTQFGQDGDRPPAGMRAAEGKNSVTERWEYGAQGFLGRSPATWCQTSTTLVLAAAAPLADGPNRAAERGGNHRIGFARRGALQNSHAFGNRCGRSMAQHTACLVLTSESA